MAYGRKNHVNLDILAYNHCLLGSSKVGKTSMVHEMMEKLVGDDGYLFLEIGKERGADAIEGINYINCPKWNMPYDEVNNNIGYEDVVNDIIENKKTDYPNLKVVIIDTYDQFIDIAEQKVIAMHNKDNPDKKIKSINAAFGGYGKGEKKAIEIMFNSLAELDSVGVRYFIIGHVKNKEVSDVVTGETYQVLTSDQQQNYFNALKKDLHILGLAYIDREIVKVKNSIKGSDKEVGRMTGEIRKIKFRDDSYCVDSGSRFRHIIDEISLDADEYIKAVTNAIEAERSRSGEALEKSKERQVELENKQIKLAEEYSSSKKEMKVDTELNEQLMTIIKEKFINSTKAVQGEILSYLNNNGYSTFSLDMPTKILETIVSKL